MTTTLRYSTASPTAADHMARIRAAGRVTAERLAAERRAIAKHAARQAYAVDLLDTLLDEGADMIGFKICGDMGKHRYCLDLAETPREYVLLSLASTYEADAEVWGITAEGNYTESVF